MKTYSFEVVVEPDDDRWHAYCPALERYGASTWGNTEEESFSHIHEVVRMVIAELTEDGIALPETPREDVEVLPDSRLGSLVLWDQFKCAGEAWPHPDYAEVAPICGQHPVDLATFRHRGHHPIDQSQAKVLEQGIEFEGTDDIGGGRWLVFVARARVENLGNQLAHRGPVLPKKVVDLREDKPRYDDESCGDQDRFILREARLPGWRAGEGSEQPTGVGYDWGSHSSRSRNSSDSSPSLVSVDSNRRVEGGRRRE
jgi:predicted RNase H-like HicB family nuclease